MLVVTRWGGNALIFGLIGATYSAFRFIGAPTVGHWSAIHSAPNHAAGSVYATVTRTIAPDLIPGVLICRVNLSLI
jgi:hypothetical protein